MATNFISVNVYRANTSSGDKSYAGGLAYGVPVTGGAVVFSPAPSGTTVGGITLNSIINVLPTGLVVPPGALYVADTVAQLITEAI